MAKIVFILTITLTFFGINASEQQCNSFDIIKNSEKNKVSGPYTAKEIEKKEIDTAIEQLIFIDNLSDYEIQKSLTDIVFNKEWLALKNKYQDGDGFYTYTITHNIEPFAPFTTKGSTILVRNNCIIGVRDNSRN